MQNIWGVVLKAASLVLGFVIVAIMARALGPEEYGIYAVVFAAVTILTVPTALGLPNYVVREVARAYGGQDEARIATILSSAGKLVLLVSSLVAVLALLWTIAGDAGASYRPTFLVGLLLIPVMALILVMGAALRGIGQVVGGLVLGLVLRHAVFLVLLIGVVALSGRLDARAAMGLHVLAAVIALAYGVANWMLHRPVAQTPRSQIQIDRRDMLRATGIMGIIAGAQTLNANLDVIMIGAFRDAETAGIYKLSATVALLTVAGLQAVNMVMMPHFARAHREDSQTQLQGLATRSARMILLTAVPTAFVLVVLGRQVIDLAFGPAFAASYFPMVILMFGQLTGALFGSVVTILNMTGYEKDAMKGILAASAVNILLNVLLIPPYGAAGAAAATAITVIVWNVALRALVRKRLAINSTPFAFGQ